MTLSLKAFLSLFAILLLIAPTAYTQTLSDNDIELMDVEEDLSYLEKPEGKGRVLATAGTYPNIRIYANYDNLTSASTNFSNYIQNELAPPVIAWFQGALRVKYPVSGLLQRTTSTTCGYTTPSDLKTGVSADYYIMFRYNTDTTSGVVVTSTYCAQASGSKRPTIASALINTYQVQAANGSVLLFERHTYLLIHEMMHTFGFLPTLFPYFLDENGVTRTGHVYNVTLNGQNRTVIDVPFLTQTARTYFGCSSLPGIFLEDDGGAGTAQCHLDKKFFMYEVMTSGVYYGRRVSQFSLGILEASGWYAPDYSYAEPFFYGQGNGCDFYNQVCNTTDTSNPFDEFCIGTVRACANTGRSGGRCSSDSLTDNCRYQLPDLDYDCENTDAVSFARLPSLQVFGRGAGSKCFTGTLNTVKSSSQISYCFKYNCTGSGLSTILQVKIGSTTLNCTKVGQNLTVSGYYGGINCPDPLTFCSTAGLAYCPRNCVGRGTCVNGQCVCDAGFSGVDCALNA